MTTEETRAELEEVLSHEVRNAIVGWTQAEAHATPAQLLQAARPILEEWVDRGDVGLDRLVRHVLVHEIAHHLGWSDDDIRAVDDWTE